MRCVPYGIRNEIQAETQLAVSVGVAASKFVTEAASEESEPDGLMIVEPRTEIAFWGAIASIDCRKVGRPCCGVRVKFRYLDIETVTRQRRVSSSVDEVILYAVARRLFAEGWKGRSL